MVFPLLEGARYQVCQVKSGGKINLLIFLGFVRTNIKCVATYFEFVAPTLSLCDSLGFCATLFEFARTHLVFVCIHMEPVEL